MTIEELDLQLSDGRTLHAYDTGPSTSDERLTVVWHHGTPNIGLPPEPLFPVSNRLGIRWLSYDRPRYGGSSPLPGRDVASAAADVRALADGLGIARFAIMGHSGGGPHALACAALLPDRVTSVVDISGLAPFGAEGLDWFAGMAPSGEASLRAAAQGRAAKERYEAAAPGGDDGFIPADHDAFAGDWGWFGKVVGPAIEAGSGGLIDDDLAYVAPWGFDAAEIVAPILFLHGERDRMVPSSHSEWNARHCPSSELWLRPDDGHISVLNSGAAALEWLAAHADQALSRPARRRG
jgi:pimeloyl-ACP methyl ester carboxylesterase